MRENLGNKVDGKRLPCDLLGMVWIPKSHEVKGLDVVNNKFETDCSIKRQMIIIM